MNARANRQLSASPHTAVLNVNAQHCSMHWQRCCLSSHGGTAVCCAKPGLGFHNLQAASHAKSGVAAGCQTSCGHSLVAWPRAPSVPLAALARISVSDALLHWTRSAGMHASSLAAGIVSRARRRPRRTQTWPPWVVAGGGAGGASCAGMPAGLRAKDLSLSTAARRLNHCTPDIAPGCGPGARCGKRRSCSCGHEDRKNTRKDSRCGGSRH